MVISLPLRPAVLATTARHLKRRYIVTYKLTAHASHEYLRLTMQVAEKEGCT